MFSGIRRWGLIGMRWPRPIQMVIVGPAELERQVYRIARRRGLHGYHVVREIRTPAVRASAA